MRFSLQWKFWKRRFSNGSAEVEAISTSSGEVENKIPDARNVASNPDQGFYEPTAPNAPQILPAPIPSNLAPAITGQDGQLPERSTRMYIDLGSLTSRLQ